MAQVLPFPLTARRRFIERQASVSLGMKAESGERHIVRTVEQQRDILLRKGVAPELVERECAELESAIRAALWKVVMTGGAA
ncbi:MAG: DUF6074 family protein [Brevundimonas sp.]|uniref:DUF6074 family protein n=1 Tax=Brevundimonas sp. TaxID=1871086 RepID=UPI00391FB60A